MFTFEFYNGRTGKKQFLSAATAILTISDPYIHVEGHFSNGQSFSSEYGIGPRIKDIGYSHSERWKGIPCPWITPEMEQRMWFKAVLHDQLRKRGRAKYDTGGAIGCAVTGKQSFWDWFCSEVCYDILPPEYKIERLNYKMHPMEFYNYLLDVETAHKEIDR